jgi:hypothetical protein
MGADAGLPLGALLYRISQYLLSAMGFERQAIVSRIDPFTGHFQYVRHAPSIQAALQEMPDFIKTREFPMILGLRVHGSHSYLLVANSLKQTCTLPPGHRVYTVSETEWVPVQTEGTLSKLEKEDLDAMLKYSLDDLHICCETYDLTLPWPNNADPYQQSDSIEFAFNHSLRQPFLRDRDLRQLCPALVQGMAQQRPLNGDGSANMIYLVRKSILNPGPRFLARGLNHNFGPANEYECELLLWRIEGTPELATHHWSSLVWRRGSVPLKWQSVTSGLTESLVVEEDSADTAEWYYYSLMQRYAYFLRHPESFTKMEGNQWVSKAAFEPGTSGSILQSVRLDQELNPHNKVYVESSPELESDVNMWDSKSCDVPLPNAAIPEDLGNSGSFRTVHRQPEPPSLPLTCISLLRVDPSSSEHALNSAFINSVPVVLQRLCRCVEHARSSSTHGDGSKIFGSLDLDVKQVDWHSEAKLHGPLKAASLVLDVYQDKQDHGFSHGTFKVDGQVNFIEAVIHQQQKGILRPNCKDSLDRTNLACFWMSLKFLPAMSREVNVDPYVYSPAFDPSQDRRATSAEELLRQLDRSVVAKLAEIFLICGDVCAMLYTRSAAMHSEMIRSLLQQSLRGLPAVPAVPIPVPEKRSNVRIGLQRLVENHLNDAERQRALTVILDMKPGVVAA